MGLQFGGSPALGEAPDFSATRQRRVTASDPTGRSYAESGRVKSMLETLTDRPETLAGCRTTAPGPASESRVDSDAATAIRQAVATSRTALIFADLADELAMQFNPEVYDYVSVVG